MFECGHSPQFSPQFLNDQTQSSELLKLNKTYIYIYNHIYVLFIFMFYIFYFYVYFYFFNLYFHFYLYFYFHFYLCRLFFTTSAKVTPKCTLVRESYCHNSGQGCITNCPDVYHLKQVEKSCFFQTFLRSNQKKTSEKHLRHGGVWR